MALRELFARFTFDFDRAKIDQITKVTQAAEAKVQGLAAAFAPAGEAIALMSEPMLELGDQIGLVTEEFSRFGAEVGVEFQGAAAAMQETAAAEEQVAAGADAIAPKLDQVANNEHKVAAGAHGMAGAFHQALMAFGIFGGVFGAVFEGRKLLDTVHEQMELAAETRETATQLGMTTEAMQVLSSVAKKGGVDTETLSGGIRTMTKNIGLFVSGAGGDRVKKVLGKMGLGIKDLKKQNPEELFFTFGKAIASIEDPVQKSAFAQRVFGEAGARMLTIFKGAPGDIDKMREAAEAAGVVFSDEFAESSHEALLAIGAMGKQFKRIQAMLIASVLPAIKWGAERLKQFGKAAAHVAETTHAFGAAFLSGGWMLFSKVLGTIFGGAGGVLGLLRKFFPLLIRFGRVLLPWIAWTLILDDIMVFLRGGDSALGRFLDTMFGAGSAAAVLQTIKEAWAAIVSTILKIGPAVKAWIESLDGDSKRIVAILLGVGLAGAAGLMPLYSVLVRIIGQFVLIVARAIATGASLLATGLNAGIAAGGFWAMAAAAAAAAAAVAGIALMLDQLNKLLTEAGGWAGIAAGVKSLVAGRGFFKGVDEAANEAARKRAAAEGRDVPTAAQPAGFFSAVPSGAFSVPSPALPPGAGGAGGAVTINDNRSVEVTVPANASPAQTGRTVAAAVTAAQPPLNLKALHGALAGAPNG